MCGIVGLFAKSPELEERLGVHLVAMLAQMSDRGPDSAGVADLPRPGARGDEQADAVLARSAEDWRAVAASVGRRGRLRAREPRRGRVPAEAAEAEARVRADRGDLRIMSAGR